MPHRSIVQINGDSNVLFELIDARDYKVHPEETISSDEAVQRAIDAQEPTGYGYFDGGSSDIYPQMSLTTAERQRFAEDLHQVVQELLGKPL